jgi:hypothetical protein
MPVKQPGTRTSASGEQDVNSQQLVTWLLEDHDRLKEKRRPWDTIYQEIYQHILPNMSLFYEVGNQSDAAGQRGDEKIFDNEGLSSLRTLVLGLMGQTVSKNIYWLQVIADQRGLRYNKRVQTYLDDLTNAFYRIYRQSNFYHVVYEYIANAASVGTGALYAEPNYDERKIYFKAFHPGEVYLEENMWGEVDKWHRTFKFSARKILQQFGASRIPQEVRDDATSENGDPGREYELVHAVYPSDDYVRGARGPRGMPYRSYYILKEFGWLLSQSGYYSKPCQFWRWYKLSGEDYGRGPGFDALVDLKGLQQISKSAIMLAQKLADPALNVPSEMEGKLRLHPRGINYYDDVGRVIQPINQGGEYNVVLDQEERKKEAIRKHFMQDVFRTLANIDRTMTATEVSQRVGENSVMIGPITSRMTTEGFNGLHERVFQLGFQMGLIPPPPPELRGANVEFEYIGPLIQSQRKFYELNGINSSIEQLLSLAQMGPQAQQAVAIAMNWEQLVERVLYANNLPPELMKTAREIRAIKQQQARAARQQQVQQERESRASAFAQTNQPVAPNSPAAGGRGG